MNENKKMLVVIGFLILIILGLLGVTFAKSKNMENTYEKFEDTINNDKRSLIYIGAAHCSYCQLLNPSIEEMKDRYNIDYLYIDTDKLNGKYIDKIVKRLGIESFGTPYLAVVENGKKVAEQTGYTDYDKLFEFLQKNEIISKDAKLSLNYIGYEDYNKLLNGSEKSVVVLGQSTCGHCINAKLVLNKIVDDKKIDINYLNIAYLKEDEHTKLGNSLEILKSSWGTPLMLIVQDGKLVDSLEGAASENEYIEFFKKNGVIK